MSEQEAHPTRRLYAIILLILLVGTGVTYWAATQDFGVYNPVIAMAIACTKATLVILFFMHVRYSSRLTKLTVAAGFFWLLIMITLSLSDYLTRSFTF